MTYHFHRNVCFMSWYRSYPRRTWARIIWLDTFLLSLESWGALWKCKIAFRTINAQISYCIEFLCKYGQHLSALFQWFIQQPPERLDTSRGQIETKSDTTVSLRVLLYPIGTDKFLTFRSKFDCMLILCSTVHADLCNSICHYRRLESNNITGDVSARRPLLANLTIKHK
jgi:hypothetical protein